MTAVGIEDGIISIETDSVSLTQNVLNQDVCRLGGLRVSGGVHSVDPELALLALLQVRDGDFSGRVELVGGVHPPPIRSALLVDLNDVTLDRAATVSVWWVPAECDAALRLVLNLWGSRRAGGV